MKKVTDKDIKDWNKELQKIHRESGIQWNTTSIRQFVEKGVLVRKYANKSLRTGNWNQKTGYEYERISSIVLKFAYDAENSYWSDPDKFLKYLDDTIEIVNKYDKYLNKIRNFIESKKEEINENNFFHQL